MIEFYPEIKLVHIWAVIASGLLFSARGAGLLAGGQWPRSLVVRCLSYTIDTTLLTAALMLMTIVQQYPFVDGWLTVKLLLLIAYIAVGAVALGRHVSPGARRNYFGAALVIYAYIVGVALAHHPFGFLTDIFGV